VRILILSFYFAPQNTLAAHRLTSLAAYLRAQGHEVRVIAAHVPAGATDADPPAGGIAVTRVRAPDLDLVGVLLRALRPLRRRSNDATAADAATRPGAALRFARWLERHYRFLFLWPDQHMGWLLCALPAALGQCRRWRPELVYASSPPAAALALGWALRRFGGAAWVAEVRDRWADDPYYPRPAWRRHLERRLEDRFLASARGLVTVSETWAESYGARLRLPTVAVYNGFNPEVYRDAQAAPCAPPDPAEPLRIVYTGSVYAGRDPTPLWRALAAMGAAADGIRVAFYGAQRAEVLPDAARFGVERLVEVRESVPHAQAVRLQCAADVLLMLQWDNPSEAGNLPGKLFEYLGARRPILALGYEAGEMARIIRQREAGLFANDPSAIVRQLEAWRAEKRRAGLIAPCPESTRGGFSREEQFAVLDFFLKR